MSCLHENIVLGRIVDGHEYSVQYFRSVKVKFLSEYVNSDTDLMHFDVNFFIANLHNISKIHKEENDLQESWTD